MFSEAESLLILISLKALKRIELKKILRLNISPKKLISHSRHELGHLLGSEFAEKIFTWTTEKKWQFELEEINRKKIKLLSLFDPDYPLAMKKLDDPPLLLYIKGKIKELSTLSVVGTRHATLYGKEMAENISAEVANKNIVIVSGLAEGIDRAAHCGALKEGLTYAVLGSGFNHIYPPTNRDLIHVIEENGALISEFSLNTTPQPYNFPRRNRIISALGDALFVVETPIKGGSMITVDESIKLNKKIFTLPGRADYETFKGNHQLIKYGKAKLVENTQDILKGMEIDIKKEDYHFLPITLTAEEKKFYDLLPAEEKSIDELVLLTQFPIMQLNVFLTRLLLKKAVKEYPGKLFKKLVSIPKGKATE